jgi:transcription antitermination protein NusB
MSRTDRPGKRRAREAALQMLYQWEIGRTGPHEAIVTYWPAHDPEGEVAEELRTFANGLVRGVTERMGEIDRLITARAVNWRVERMAVIDRMILRLACLELMSAVDTPAKVIINEAIELARTYSSEESVPFVNGVLDAIRRDLNRE